MIKRRESWIEYHSMKEVKCPCGKFLRDVSIDALLETARKAGWAVEGKGIFGCPDCTKENVTR